jgi:sugar lactone lactonase YvrE
MAEDNRAGNVMTLYGFYVSFSGESTKPINNVYALSKSGATVSKAVLDPSQKYDELRGMSFGPDGNFYVAQAQQSASAILQFNGALPPNSSTMTYMGQFATPTQSAGLDHPYQPIFATDGNLYVSSQDKNVVTGFYGPQNGNHGSAMPDSQFLTCHYANGTFYAGTFVPAYSAKYTVPTPVPPSQGGLTFITTSSGSTHSVRGVAFDDTYFYVADEANNRVAVFDNTGNFLGAITQSKDHSLSGPVALCFDAANGTLYIGSPGNGRLFTYNVSGVANGNFTANSLINDKDLDKLSGIAVDPQGYIYTGDRSSNKIHQWKPDGSSHTTFAGPFDDSPEQIIAVYTPITGTSTA